MPDAIASAFMRAIHTNPVNTELLRRLGGLGLPQWHLTAGCLFQTYWNLRSQRPATEGIKDYDVFYFDDTDLSGEAEDAAIRRVKQATADVGVEIEVKNQARVHLWYGQRFHTDYPQLFSVRDGIDRYLVACTCIGVEVEGDALYATHGLDELVSGVLRINPTHPQPAMFAAKARDYQRRWPWLRIVPARLDARQNPSQIKAADVRAG